MDNPQKKTETHRQATTFDPIHVQEKTARADISSLITLQKEASLLKAEFSSFRSIDSAFSSPMPFMSEDKRLSVGACWTVVITLSQVRRNPIATIVQRSRVSPGQRR